MATRITAKQKSARRKNIKIAQQSRKRGGKRKLSAKQLDQKSRGIAAFKKAYKSYRKKQLASPGSKHKGWAVAKGHSAMKWHSPTYGKKRIKKFGAAKKWSTSRKRDYSSLLSDL